MTMPLDPLTLEAAMARLAATTSEVKREMAELRREQAAREAERAAREVERAAREVEREAQREREQKERAAQIEANRRENNKNWGDLANRFGTMTEDLVAPSVDRIVQEVFGVQPEETALLVRLRGRSLADRSRSGEFDAVVLWPGHLLMNETRSKLDTRLIDDVPSRIADLRELLPEYAHRKAYASVAALSVDESLVRYAEERGLLVLAVGDQLMDVMNSPGFRPREF